NMISDSPANVSGLAYVVPPPCAPSCAGASCGDDGCGGSCGSCAAGLACGPTRPCSPWYEETVSLPALLGRAPLSFAMTPAGEHSILIDYTFAEHYYTSGSTQDELFYLGDHGGGWSVLDPSLVVGIPQNAFAQTMLVPSSLQISSLGTPEAVFG